MKIPLFPVLQSFIHCQIRRFLEKSAAFSTFRSYYRPPDKRSLLQKRTPEDDTDSEEKLVSSKKVRLILFLQKLKNILIFYLFYLLYFFPGVLLKNPFFGIFPFLLSTNVCTFLCTSHL